LPLRDEKECQLSGDATNALVELSPRVRRLQTTLEDLEDEEKPARIDGSYSSEAYRRDHPKVNEPLRAYVSKAATDNKRRPAIVGPMEQMIQTEKAALRQTLVESLSSIKGKEATAALARRAVFDLSPVVRSQAVKALAKRSLEDSRPVFLAALRHPWAPAADHAAYALSELNDQKAFDSVRQLVDEPDPRQPFLEDKKWFVREVVRVNHLRNCLLCHAVSVVRSESVRAPIPESGKPLPRVYYSSRSPEHSIRADIVYFRQDFSVMHKVAKAAPWPKYQRFDYLVRKRELTPKEIEKRKAAVGKDKPAPTGTYPQRDAVLYTVFRLALAKEKGSPAPRSGAE
jgi:hypothetical protein